MVVVFNILGERSCIRQEQFSNERLKHRSVQFISHPVVYISLCAIISVLYLRAHDDVHTFVQPSAFAVLRTKPEQRHKANEFIRPNGYVDSRVDATLFCAMAYMQYAAAI